MTRKLGMLVLIGSILVTAQALGNGGAKRDCSPADCAAGQVCAPCPSGPCDDSCPMPCASGGEADVAVLTVE